MDEEVIDTFLVDDNAPDDEVTPIRNAVVIGYGGGMEALRSPQQHGGPLQMSSCVLDITFMVFQSSILNNSKSYCSLEAVCGL